MSKPTSLQAPETSTRAQQSIVKLAGLKLDKKIECHSSGLNRVINPFTENSTRNWHV